jgi:hypothetical protein
MDMSAPYPAAACRHLRRPAADTGLRVTRAAAMRRTVCRIADTPPLSAAPPPGPGNPAGRGAEASISDRLENWLEGDGDHTVGGLIAVFEEKSFALLFILLLGVSALPLPTGGATHLFDVVAVIVAGQLVAGRDHIWVPDRWRALTLGGGRQRRFVNGLLRGIRFLERLSKPRLAFLFDHRLSNSVFGVVVIVYTTAAFFAPPFSGLDTLPALGVVLVSLGVLLEDIAIVGAGLVVGLGGIALEITLGKAAAGGIKKLL